MPGAVIVADQPLGAGAGVPGEARSDLWLSRAVNLSVGTSGNTTYEWELLDKPLGSAAVLSTPTAATSGFTPDIIGTYRVRLVTNGGGAGNIQILVFRVRYNSSGALSKRGWAMPAIGETAGEANYGGNTRAWAQVLEDIIGSIDTTLDDLATSLGGRPLDTTTALSPGDVYVWDGTEWVPGPAFAPGGDLGGSATAQVVEGIQGIAVDVTAPLSGQALVFNGTEWAPGAIFVPPSEVALVAGEHSTSESSFTRVCLRKIDLSSYPAVAGLTRTVTLIVALESSVAGVTAQVRLRDVTDDVDVTGSALDNSAAADVTLPHEVAIALPVGTASGELRDDVAHFYEVQIARSGGAITDRAICGSARLLVSYA